MGLPPSNPKNGKWQRLQINLISDFDYLGRWITYSWNNYNLRVEGWSTSKQRRHLLLVIWAMYLPINLPNSNKLPSQLLILTYLDTLDTSLQSNQRTFTQRPTERSLKTVIKATITRESSFPLKSNTPQPPRTPMSTLIASKNRN